MGVVKKFLIEAVNIVSQERFSKIATIIPTDEYCLNHNPETISYLNKPAFRGVIVYGNFDCSLSNIYIYGPHPIQVGRIIDANEAENYEYVRYLSLIDFSNLTKSDNEELEASVCIGVTKPKPWFPEDNSGDDVIETNPGSNVGDLEEPRIGDDDDNFIGGGGSSDNQIDSAKM